MHFRIEEGDKFAIVAFANIGFEPELIEETPIDLGDGLWVLDRPHFELPHSWRKWIGSIKADRVNESNLLILAKRAGPDHETEKLQDEVDRLLYGLVLQGMPKHVAAYRLSDAVLHGETTVGQFTELYDHHSFEKRTPVSPETCKIAKVAANGIKETVSPIEFLRLQRGLIALIDASRERYMERALHQFVRATEALIVPRIGKSRKDFVHRCQTFTIANDIHRLTFESIYDIRSNVAHMHEWNGTATAEEASKDEHILRNRLHQIEALCLSIYLKIMTSARHREIFRTNASIEAFWSLPDDARADAWGERDNLINIGGAV